jgi:hypothetical protein
MDFFPLAANAAYVNLLNGIYCDIVPLKYMYNLHLFSFFP